MNLSVLYVVTAVRKFDMRLLQAKHLTNGDQWKGQTVIESLFSLTIVTSIKELYAHRGGQQ